ncbi:hypothetical protein COU60_01340 [Candidatus Pacearchaeota archaeon CG10_big_fil_rev_8_21_14_0_10_34_76]|nr:MAG: hypothetical protein COU60_01340 [Candidatus Pacearchaeota archaeon CG10_big_fil_rev_8_21_14_0_10_34_76]
MKVYHYIETENLREILANGLKPSTIDPAILPRDGRKYVVRSLYGANYITRTNPEFFREELSRFLNIELRHPFLFTCALLEPSPKGWLELGLMSKLMNQRFFARHKTPTLLEIELSRTDSVFVRDAAINFAEKGNGSWEEYLNSNIPLEEYTGGFIAPEIWIPTPISQKLIREIPIPNSL